MDTGRPYKDIEVNKDYVIREFDDGIDPIELMWHRDAEDRLIEPLMANNWGFQYDNELPIPLTKNKPLKIGKYEWHRVIKGDGNLLLKITKLV